MKLKETNITANIVWSPSNINKVYLAAATSAQQLDASFTGSPELKVYDINAKDPSLNLKVAVTKPLPSRVNQLLWRSGGNNDGEKSEGVIVACCEDANIYVYSANKLLKSQDALLLELKGRHAGSVNTIAFNNHQTNLLASGSKNCEVFIWDINAEEPITPMTPGAKPNLSVDVSHISWNRKVEHIMAAAYTGSCIVYDLRKSSSIVQISENVSRLKASKVYWHPNVATQLIVTSDNDTMPVAQMWDLRMASAPVNTLDGHQRGVSCAAWCGADPDLFVTCGKDNKTLVWNPNSAVKGCEVVGEFPSYNQWHFDISWCERDPSLVAVSSIDSYVSVYSMLGAGSPPNQTSKFSAIADSFPGMELPQEIPQTNSVPIQLKKPPTWFPSKCGASFGFGGKLISWGADNRVVNVSQIITEEEFIMRSQEMENAISQVDVKSYCEHKSLNTIGKNQELWKFLEASCDPESRKKYSLLLGFSMDAVASKVRPHSLDAQDIADKISELSLQKPLDSSSDPTEQFEMIAASNASKTPEVIESPESNEKLSLEIGNDYIGLLRNAIIVGDFESAVEVCLKEGQNSLALILASQVGGDIFKKTQDRILASECSIGVSPLLSTIVGGNFTEFVENCELKDWKPALVTLLTYADDSHLAAYSSILGERLENSKRTELHHAALLCFICAGDLNRFAECFSKTTPSVDRRTQELQDIVEFLVVLQKTLKASGRSVKLEEKGSATKVLSRYSSILASQGALSTALAYLDKCQQESFQSLQSRLRKALGYPEGRTDRLRSTSTSSQHSIRRVSTPHNIRESRMQPPFSGGQVGIHSAATFTPQMPQQAKLVPVPSYPSNAMQQQSFGYQPPYSQPQYGMTAPSYGYDATPSYGTAQQSFQPGPPPTAAEAPAMNFSNRRIGSARHVANTEYEAASPNVPNIPQLMMQPEPAYQASKQAAHDESLPTPAAFDPAVPRGWNDPPTLSTTRKQKNQTAKFDPSSMPGMMIPEQQKPPQFGGGPPPTGFAPTTFNATLQNRGEVSQQNFSTGFQPIQGAGFQASTGFQHSGQAPQAAPEPMPAPVAKRPIPSEHVEIQQVFNSLRDLGLQRNLNHQAKQRIEDASPKLEILYDKLRENQISKSTTDGLHKIVEYVRTGQYHQALLAHSATVSSGNFSEMASFMPALKNLLTTCMQCQIFLQ